MQAMLSIGIETNMSYLGDVGAVPKQGLRKRAVDVLDRRGGGLKESQIQRQCEGLLDAMGVCYIRIPDSLNAAIFGSDKVKPHIKKLISSFTKGVPDITILSKCGRFYCVELKTEKGKLSQGQKTFCRKVGEDNFYVIRSVEGLQELIVEKDVQ